MIAVSLLPLTVHAGEFIDPGQEATLTMERLPSGVEVSVYKVADMSGSTDSLHMTPSYKFYSYGVDLDSLDSQQWRELAELLAVYIERDYIPPDHTAHADDTGRAEIGEVTPGLYLVIPESGGGIAFSPMMISVPMLNERNSWTYNVTAAPKIANSAGSLPGGFGQETGLTSITAYFRGFASTPAEAVLKIETLYGDIPVRMNAANNYTCDFGELYSDDISGISKVSLTGYNNDDYEIDFEISGDRIIAAYSCTAPPLAPPNMTMSSAKNSAKNSIMSSETGTAANTAEASASGGGSARNNALYMAKQMMLPAELFRTASDKTPVYVFGSIGVAAVLAGIMIIRKKSEKK